MDTTRHNQREHYLAITPTMDWSASAALPRHRAQEDAAVALPSRPRRDDVLDRPLALVAEGSTVRCRDGTAGLVTAVLKYSDRGYPTHLVVRHGRWRARVFRVPFAWVTAITPHYVELGLSKCELLQHPLYHTDDEITDELVHALHGVEACSDFVMVNVVVRNGVVELFGNVHTHERRQAAEQVAMGVAGVLAVRNRLRADDEITWQATWRLTHDRRLQVRQLQVDACLGLLHLQGYVASAQERTRAAQIAGEVPGVHAIRNNLLVMEHAAHAHRLEAVMPVHAPVTAANGRRVATKRM